MTGLSRRELLRRGALALAAGNIYTLLDDVGAAPARAAISPRRAPEQYLLGGQRLTLELGIEVIMPARHHRVVTARVRPAAALRTAQRRLDRALTALERDYPNTPSGLGITLAWGLPYFSRLVPRLADGQAYPHYLPVDQAASKAKGSPVPAIVDATPFASDDRPLVLGRDDLAVVLRSDNLGHIDHAQHAIFTELEDVLETTSVRSGFVGDAKSMAIAAAVPGAEAIVDGVQMFLGFTSTQKAAMAPDRIASFETMPGQTNQKPGGFWSGGTAMHLSHLDEDVERWWTAVPYSERLRSSTRPGLDVPDETYTIAEDVTQIETPTTVRADLARYGGVGHSATLQTVTRLARDTRDAYGTVRPRGTAIVQRADFNTLDNPFAYPATNRTPSAGVHFIAFVPTIGLFVRARRAMDGVLGDGSRLPLDARATSQGFNSFIHATHRQNFVVPPRSRRSFPLADLAATRRA